MNGISKITKRARVACEEIGWQHGEEMELNPRMKRYQFKDLWDSVGAAIKPDKSFAHLYHFGTK